MFSQIPTYPDQVHYPDSDGQPMADNTRQFRWIVTLHQNIADWFAQDPNVFVAGDLLWYPVPNQPEIRQAPDVMVVFGRPKGDRGSYIQHREDDIPPQVVFEILSPGNSLKEMARKLAFYDRYGVEEYYVYDPERNRLWVWIRSAKTRELAGGDLVKQWTSPRLEVRFEVEDPEMKVYRPDGSLFESFAEVRQKVIEADQRAREERLRADRLAQRLRELGLDPDTL
jgi:Uma2 family endonuclease